MKTSTAQDRLSQTLQRIDGAYSPSTIRAYRADFSEYIGFAEQLGKVALPTDSLTVADFIDYLMQRGQKSASIGRSISGISAIHSFNKEADPTKDIEVKLAMKRMYRKIGRHQRQAQGINKDMLDQMLAVTEKDLRGERDRALLLIAYALKNSLDLQTSKNRLCGRSAAIQRVLVRRRIYFYLVQACPLL
jgi:site-specific recombinase XerD